MENKNEINFTLHFIQSINEKINLRKYPSKENLIDELQQFYQENKNMENFNEAEFQQQMKTVLESYDKINQINATEGIQNFSEFTRDDGRMGATYHDGKQMHTLIQDKNGKTFQEQMNLAYNENAVNSVQNNTPLQDSVEQNFNLLQKYVKEEVSMNNEPINNESSLQNNRLREVLNNYANKYHLHFEFSHDGLARDEYGNMYEAIEEKNGDIRIERPITTTYPTMSGNTQEKVVLEHITNAEMNDLSKNQDSIMDPNTARDLAIINTAMNYPDYEAFLRDPYLKLSEEKIQYLKSEIEKNLHAIHSSYKQEQQEKGKVFVYKNNPPRDIKQAGFTQILLLTSTTLLFGLICTGYIFSQIIK